MLRLVSSVFFLGATALAVLVASTRPPPSVPPNPFSHKAHLEYFRDGRHRRSMVSLHEEAFNQFRDGSHGRSMVAMHKETLLKELEDEDIVAGMLGDIEKGYCTQCHRNYDDNARNLAKLAACGECHGRKGPENETFAADMTVDVEEGRCKLCHGEFDKNAGEHIVRLGHCAECHRVALEHDWEGREDQRPCIGCHNAVVRSERASIPGTSTCAACHPLEGDYEDDFVEQEGEIGRVRVYNYMPSEIVFSHERHVELGRVPCQECHGAVGQTDGPLALEVKLSMEDCMSCHEFFGADNDCLACHR